MIEPVYVVVYNLVVRLGFGVRVDLSCAKHTIFVMQDNELKDPTASYVVHSITLVATSRGAGASPWNKLSASSGWLMGIGLGLGRMDCWQVMDVVMLWLQPIIMGY